MCSVKNIEIEKLQKEINIYNTLFGVIGINTGHSVIQNTNMFHEQNNWFIKSTTKSSFNISIWNYHIPQKMNEIAHEYYNVFHMCLFAQGYTLLFGSAGLFTYGIFNLIIIKK